MERTFTLTFDEDSKDGVLWNTHKMATSSKIARKLAG